MPERNYDAFDGDDRQAIADYVPGYDWIPGRFGPPPGIPKQRKDEFDKMTDKEYLYAVLKLSQEEKESLMVSEAERRRTYVAHWPIETIVKANDCAKEGFYYTGVADRVQCAFCGGVVRNWERGDAPKIQHKNFFNYCKIVQNKPCHNIPIDGCGIPQDMRSNQLTSTPRHDLKPSTLGELNINTIKPKDAALSVYSKRIATYRHYPDSYPIKADALCSAGFFYEGIGDKVKCFWCDGALEMWSAGDDPWTEHAKWYPGCTHTQQTKGTEFIKKARSKMTPDNISTADTLIYNKGDVSFLDEKAPVVEEKLKVDQLGGYKFCLSLGYSAEVIKRAYAANNDTEFEVQSELVEIVQDLADEKTTSLENFAKTVKKVERADDDTRSTDTTTQPSRRVNVPEMIMKPDEDNEQDSRDFLQALTCKRCRKILNGALVLPCGCFCLCQGCSRGDLPQKCPACTKLVKGAFRTTL